MLENGIPWQLEQLENNSIFSFKCSYLIDKVTYTIPTSEMKTCPILCAVCEPQFTSILVTFIFISNTYFQDRNTHFYPGTQRFPHSQMTVRQ